MQIFITDEYSTEYFNIIANADCDTNAKKFMQEAAGEIIEQHHIIPKSFYKIRKGTQIPGWIEGNADDANNLALLSARDHYRCHWLLVHMKLVDATNQAKASQRMAYALFRMSNSKHCQLKYEINEEMYVYSRTNVKPQSEEARKKLSTSLKGRIVTAVTRQKIGLANTGKIRSKETKDKISATLSGRKLTEDQCNSRKGKVRSTEYKEKMSKAKQGHLVTTETCVKISASKKGKPSWHKGKTRSEKTKIKMSLAQKGKPKSLEYCKNMKLIKQNISDETRSKMSASAKGRIPWNKGLSKKNKLPVVKTNRGL